MKDCASARRVAKLMRDAVGARRRADARINASAGPSRLCKCSSGPRQRQKLAPSTAEQGSGLSSLVERAAGLFGGASTFGTLGRRLHWGPCGPGRPRPGPTGFGGGGACDEEATRTRARPKRDSNDLWPMCRLAGSPTNAPGMSLSILHSGRLRAK